MAIKRPTGSRSEVVRCPNCGEDYSVTYKRCPFCDEKNLPPEDEYDEPDDDYMDDDEDERPARRGGKRVAGQRRGGGYGGGGFSVVRMLVTVASLALIVAAVFIVFNVISPMINRGEIDPPPSQLPSASPVVEPTVAPSAPVEPTAPGVTDDPIGPTPSVASPAPSGNLTLSSVDFSLFTVGDSYTFRVTGASGAVTFTSDKSEVATVDQKGRVTAVSKGLANITATDASGAVAKCVVRCNLPDGAAATPQPSASTGSAKLNREDFTLTEAGQKFQLKVTGATGTPTWSISGNGEATITSDGTVTAVSKGKLTVTCTVDGQTLNCIVRCNW